MEIKKPRLSPGLFDRCDSIFLEANSNCHAVRAGGLICVLAARLAERAALREFERDLIVRIHRLALRIRRGDAVRQRRAFDWRVGERVPTAEHSRISTWRADRRIQR